MFVCRYKCKESAGEEVFEMLCDEEHFSKYRQMQINSFVDENDQIAWYGRCPASLVASLSPTDAPFMCRCPGPKCGRAIAYSKRRKTIKCLCTYKFWCAALSCSPINPELVSMFFHRSCCSFSCKEEAHAPASCDEVRLPPWLIAVCVCSL